MQHILKINYSFCTMFFKNHKVLLRKPYVFLQKTVCFFAENHKFFLNRTILANRAE